MEIPVLTYHSNNISGNDYESNDHVALAADLRALHQAGFAFVSLERVYRWYLGAELEEEKPVAITMDDGSWFDYYDLEHPSCGHQRSMFNVVKDFIGEMGSSTQPDLCLSSFVIASPEAREQLDKKALAGLGWWSDEWWSEAQSSGLMTIECHSWDHCHPLVDRVAQSGNLKGDFSAVANFRDSDMQVAHAGDYIASRLAGRRPSFFAYPWGEASAYMTDAYMPGSQERHQFLAAFSTEPRAVSRDDHRWMLPRFVCGRDWRSSAELIQSLTPL